MNQEGWIQCKYFLLLFFFIFFDFFCVQNPGLTPLKQPSILRDKKKLYTIKNHVHTSWLSCTFFLNVTSSSSCNASIQLFISFKFLKTKVPTKCCIYKKKSSLFSYHKYYRYFDLMKTT